MTLHAMTDYSLPDRISPFPDECLAGLILRYAELYHFRNPHALFSRLAGPKRLLSSYALLDPAGPDWRQVTRLLNLSGQEATRMSLRMPSPRSLSLRGNPINLDFADCSIRQVCPDCLREQAYHRDTWLLAITPACPRHRTPLIRECPACSVPLKWTGHNVCACSNPDCQFDLREARLPELPEERIVGIRGLLGLMDNGPHPSGLGFGDAVRAALFFGAFRCGLPYRWPRISSFIAEHRSELPDILAAGWALLEPWPTGFHTFLGSLLEGASARSAKRGLLKGYGPLFTALAKQRPLGWTKPFLDEIYSYSVGREEEIDIRPHVIRRHVVAEAAFFLRVSAFEAAKMVGVSQDTLELMMTKAGIAMAPGVASAQKSVFLEDVERLQVLRQRYLSELTNKTAAKILGVGEGAIVDLADAGLLKQLPENERVEPFRRFLPEHAQELLTVFEAAADNLLEVESPSKDYRIMGQRGGAKDGFGVIRITQEVFAGTLKPVAIWSNGVGLQRYLFPRFMPGANRRRASAT